MAYEANYDGTPMNNNYNNDNNGQKEKWFDLAGRSYSCYTGTMTWEPTYDGKAPTMLVRMAKASNPGEKNTPCDWKNVKVFAMEQKECYDVLNWAKVAKAAIANNAPVENLKFFHKNNGGTKSLAFSVTKNGAFSALIGEGENNYVNITVGGPEWAMFLGACEWLYKYGIGIRAMLGEIAKIVGKTSEFNQVERRGKFGNNNNGGGNNNNGYVNNNNSGYRNNNGGGYNNKSYGNSNNYNSSRNYQAVPAPKSVPAPTYNQEASYGEDLDI